MLCFVPDLDLRGLYVRPGRFIAVDGPVVDIPDYDCDFVVVDLIIDPCY